MKRYPPVTANGVAAGGRVPAALKNNPPQTPPACRFRSLPFVFQPASKSLIGVQQWKILVIAG
jgi:hypothetical protein